MEIFARWAKIVLPAIRQAVAARNTQKVDYLRSHMAKASKLSEVARLAGVSPITASRAIRGTGYVSEGARTRIMEAARQLNYTPDMLARRMRGEKSKLIGVF